MIYFLQMTVALKNKHLLPIIGLTLLAVGLISMDTASAANCGGLTTSIIDCGTAGSEEDGVWRIIIQVINFLAV